MMEPASALARSDPTLLAKSDPPHRYVLVPGFACGLGKAHALDP